MDFKDMNEKEFVRMYELLELMEKENIELLEAQILKRNTKNITVSVKIKVNI